MNSTTALVVKVSYEGVLRRFRVPFKVNGQLDLDIAGLKGKISTLFSLSSDAEFSLTYADEDGDLVALVDDNDLFDVTNQRLKFLKINVVSKSNNTTAGSESSESVPNGQDPVSKIQKGINDVLMAVPNPMLETLSKVYMDLASKAASSSPVVGEMLDCISNLGKLPKESNPNPNPCPPVTKQPGCSSSSGPSMYKKFPSPGQKAGNLYKPIEVKTSVHVPVSSGKGVSFSECPLANNLNKTTDVKTASSGKGVSFSECPFSGSNMNGFNPNANRYDPVLNNDLRRVCHNKKSSNGDYWTPLGVCHKGIQCDGCGALPITGPRFKSKVKEDFDLCSVCFSVMGNEGDYARMDKPVSTQFLHPFRGQLSQLTNPWLGHPVPRPHQGSVPQFRCTRPKLDSRFVLDVNVLDGTVVAPSSPFSKIWKMRNNGSLVWPRGTQIVWIGGDRFSSSLSVDLPIPVEGVPINGEFDVKVDFIAPESPGRYISYWRMASSNGAKFGQRVWVLIHVDASVNGSVKKEFQGLNLNASPDEDFSREFTGINDPAQPGSSSANPVVVKDDVLIDDVDIVVPSTHVPSFDMFSLQPAVVEFLPGDSSSSVKEEKTPLPVEEDIVKNDVEVTMLKELEAMGFKEIDLNKEILRDNEYNFEQSVDALCGVNEWDPILEELQEMGFCDDVTNKRLLMKNNGSIKGVVMDLLTGEKEA